MHVEERRFSEWADAQPERGIGVLHAPEALRVVDQHSPGELRLFSGFKGQEAVGLFPINVRSKFGARVLTSPPLGFGIGRLGPIVMEKSPKQRKQESANKEFIRKVLDTVDADAPLTLFRTACSTRYRDPRPFEWSGFDVSSAFTYRLDLADRTADQVLESFARNLRREIRKQDDVEFSIRTAGMKAAKHTYRSWMERFEEQGQRHPLAWEFVRDLLEALDERARVYVAESPDGEFISGMIILYSNDTAYAWIGGTKTTKTSVSPNTLLHWRIIQDILTDPELEGIKVYDQGGANTERLAKYKSCLGGALTEYYLIESNSSGMAVAKRIYKMVAYGNIPSASGTA